MTAKAPADIFPHCGRGADLRDTHRRKIANAIGRDEAVPVVNRRDPRAAAECTHGLRSGARREVPVDPRGRPEWCSPAGGVF